ncbi:ankyrin repeat domain-containing protein [Ramlibacter sp. WS9]|uniref:ankyrin repeat domain-containing protein n=1 Tax=Ramlibacter sp. WS9 TaxID=1882741 RepID=UPI001143FD74|nr:ankyrin repeat domain-containing protein [Ramlibacter sp. WS9]ROZ63878.1 ankyrin repeat domain-containing protein [Ramlibacter sp. WS9]
MTAQVALEAYRAVVAGQFDAFRELFDRHPELLQAETPFGSLLHVAASHGHMEVVRGLVSLGADVNRRGGTFAGAPINVAASNGYLDIVRYLLEAGATLDISEPERNPLFGAVYGGHLQVVRVLVQAGIDTDIRYTGESMEAMDAAAFAKERGQVEIASYLEGLQRK